MTVTGVLRDPAGRLSALKIVVLLLALWPGAVLLLRWQAHDLGPRPITEATHITGLWAIRFVIITLAVTPARAVLDWPRVVLLRRMLGVTAACYATLHFSIFVLDQQFNLFKVMTEILSRFYLTVGWFTLMGLLALAITSTDGWQKSLGRDWKRLHKLVYPIAFLGLFHYATQLKLDISDAVFLIGLFAWLGLWRLVPRRRQTKLWTLPGLALAAGLLAAIMEAAWYAVRNGVDAWMVISSNLDVMPEPRPAVAATLVGVLLLGVVMLRRAVKWLGKRRGISPRRASTQGA